MSVIAFDTETERFRPGCMAPELACVSFQFLGQPKPGLLHHTQARDNFIQWLHPDRKIVFVGANVAYDFAVLGANYPDLVPWIFQAYEEDRVTDIQWRQKLLDIAGGCYRGRTTSDGTFVPFQYSLASLAKRLAGRVLVKDDTRTSFGSLRELPLDQWPEGARAYSLDDAAATLECYVAQEVHKEFLENQFREARAYWGLHLMSCWGLRTKEDLIVALEAATRGEIAAVQGRLVTAGLIRPNGTRNTKAAQERMLVAVKEPRLTPTGKPCLDGEACEASEDPLLEDYGEYTVLNKVLASDVKLLAEGVNLPIHCRYDLAGTGRTTCSKPNVQNLRRMPGIREAFVPRHGNVFIDADYGSLELFSLAQMQLYLFGHSVLADVLNGGRDPHTALAADILGITYEAAAKRKKDHGDHEFSNARQTAKVANFGLPGGLGAEKFVFYAKKSYQVVLTVDRARELKQQWLARWPEMKEYFAYINTLCDNPMNLATVKVPVANMTRAGCTYTAACNTLFQGLAAAAAKNAVWLVAKACYVDKSSPLFGSRPVAFIHDQLLIETPEGPGMHDAAMETGKLMHQAAKLFMPDVTPSAEPILSRYWSKDANEVRDAAGRLIPWAA